jgi:hypothetical protein
MFRFLDIAPYPSPYVDEPNVVSGLSTTAIAIIVSAIVVVIAAVAITLIIVNKNKNKKNGK